jgi:hypothetical protein
MTDENLLGTYIVLDSGDARTNSAWNSEHQEIKQMIDPPIFEAYDMQFISLYANNGQFNILKGLNDTLTVELKTSVWNKASVHDFDRVQPLDTPFDDFSSYDYYTYNLNITIPAGLYSKEQLENELNAAVRARFSYQPPKLNDAAIKAMLPPALLAYFPPTYNFPVQIDFGPALRLAPDDEVLSPDSVYVGGYGQYAIGNEELSLMIHTKITFRDPANPLVDADEYSIFNLNTFKFFTIVDEADPTKQVEVVQFKFPPFVTSYLFAINRKFASHPERRDLYDGYTNTQGERPISFFAAKVVASPNRNSLAYLLGFQIPDPEEEWIEIPRSGTAVVVVNNLGVFTPQFDTNDMDQPFNDFKAKASGVYTVGSATALRIASNINLVEYKNAVLHVRSNSLTERLKYSSPTQQKAGVIQSVVTSSSVLEPIVHVNPNAFSTRFMFKPHTVLQEIEMELLDQNLNKITRIGGDFVVVLFIRFRETRT